MKDAGKGLGAVLEPADFSCAKGLDPEGHSDANSFLSFHS